LANTNSRARLSIKTSILAYIKDIKNLYFVQFQTKISVEGQIYTARSRIEVES
jgi:hypothetical protein